MRKRLIIFLALALSVSACTMIPKYERPKPPVPQQWGKEAAGEGALAANVPWRQFFTDPRLQAVIELALANNRDLRTAALNVERAAAVYRIQRSDIFPDFGIQAMGNNNRLPERINDGKAQNIEQYSVQIGILSWELDLFGRIRSLSRAALQQFFASQEAQAAAQISLVAAVGQTYLLLNMDQQQYELARGTLEAQTSVYDLISKSRDAGIASDLDLRQAESQMEAARVDVARYRGLVEVDKHALDELAGVVVPSSLAGTGQETPMQLKEVEAGLSSEILLQRPDILFAEHQLLSANANIGAARAAFFPRITLTLGGGTLSPDLAGLFGPGTGTWTFVPTIIQPIYAGGLQRANLKVAKVDRQIAVAQYEKAIQTAFREVSDALSLRDSLKEQLQAQQSLVDALQETYRLSNARYEAGIDSYLGVLVAQRALYVAQQGQVQLQQVEQANRVTLFKALGGGL